MIADLPRQPVWPLPLCGVALVVPLADLLLIGVLHWDYLGTPQRVSLALFACIVLNEASNRTGGVLGSALAPDPNWRYWGWVMLFLGGILGLLVSIGLFISYWTGHTLPIPRVTPGDIPEALNRMCVEAPLIEEVIYCQAVCGAVLALAGPLWAIAVSGVPFALLHWVYGNPSLENQVGGFLLAWMYLRSGTLAVPILFHALGNLAALVLMVLVTHFR
jgi:membrane protease YdiL (CAAX protease family)